MKKKIIAIIAVVAIFAGGTHIFKPFVPTVETEYGYDLPKHIQSSIYSSGIETVLQKHSNQIESLVINEGGQTLLQYGKYNKAVLVASVRKSILNLLFGIAVSKNLITLDKNLAELGIDENKSPLSDTEKTATIRDLLMSRSGVYIESGGETKEMKKERPKRGSYKPGEHFYYNNWDFNVLGYVFEKEMKLKIGEAILSWLAKPLGMQDFDISHVTYTLKGEISQYPTFWLFMSARDLAKIGSLMLQGGNWNGKVVISEEWISESTQPYSKSNYEEFGYYGYLWWIDKKLDVYGALGVGGQYLLVDAKNNLCIAITKDTGSSMASVWYKKQFDKGTKLTTLLEIHSVLKDELLYNSAF